MFHVGEFVVYGSQGVCKVTDVGCLNLSGAPSDRRYYTLEPCHILGGKVFTPVDNQKAIIRPVISKDEAMSLIDDMTDIETLWVPDERKRESYYKDALRKCDCRELVKIIKTTYLRKQSRAAAGKKVTAGDEKYLHLAEANLYGELAVALDMEQENVKQFIIDRIKGTQEPDAEIS
ncbi:CarD family transcriptional regulator [Lachnospiraceae bacterium 46-15]